MLYNVVLVSAIQQHKSVVSIHMSPPSWIPANSCSICQEYKILAVLLMDHFSRLHLQQATFRDNVLLLTKSWLALVKQWKQWIKIKNSESPSSVFLFLPISLGYNWHVRACKLLQSCPTLCDLMDCSRPSSSVHGILQARIPEGVAIPFSRGSFGPRDRICVSYASWIGRQVLYH